MYEKPELTRFGGLRDLTRIGISADCDGGVFGIGDGEWWRCDAEDRS